jgi:hypothetical protein
MKLVHLFHFQVQLMITNFLILVARNNYHSLVIFHFKFCILNNKRHYFLFVNLNIDNYKNQFIFNIKVIGYTQLKAMDRIRTPKLSCRRRGLYLVGHRFGIPRADNKPVAFVF